MSECVGERIHQSITKFHNIYDSFNCENNYQMLLILFSKISLCFVCTNQCLDVIFSSFGSIQKILLNLYRYIREEEFDCYKYRGRRHNMGA